MHRAGVSTAPQGEELAADGAADAEQQQQRHASSICQGPTSRYRSSSRPPLPVRSSSLQNTAHHAGVFHPHACSLLCLHGAAHKAQGVVSGQQRGFAAFSAAATSRQPYAVSWRQRCSSAAFFVLRPSSEPASAAAPLVGGRRNAHAGVSQVSFRRSSGRRSEPTRRGWRIRRAAAQKASTVPQAGTHDTVSQSLLSGPSGSDMIVQYFSLFCAGFAGLRMQRRPPYLTMRSSRSVGAPFFPAPPPPPMI